jgi:hypothetical protein
MPNGIDEIKAAMERRSRRMPAPRRAPLAPTDDAEARQDAPPPATVTPVAPAVVEQPPQPTVAAQEPDEEPTRQLTARLPLSLDDHLREFEHQARRRGLRDLTRQELVRHLVASLPTGGAELDGVVSALHDRRRR